MAYTLERVPDAWWREVILLEAGYLSTQGKERTTQLVRGIADLKEEPEPYHNLVLAAECLRDVAGNRVAGNLEGELEQRLRRNVEKPPTFMDRWFRRVARRDGEKARPAPRKPGYGRAGIWNKPYGEPEWVFSRPASSGWEKSESPIGCSCLPIGSPGRR